jgi:hypothetical protein
MTEPEVPEDEQLVAAQADDFDGQPQKPDDRVRNAVIIVHGMGQQRPLDTLKAFVRTALPPLGGGWRYYYSRPATVTKSYEARRYIARPLVGEPAQPQTEIFEYHWSYMMTGNRLGDLFPSTARLLLRWVGHVPPQLLGIWIAAWCVLLLVIVLVVIGFFVAHVLPGWLTAVLSGTVVLGLLGAAARVMRKKDAVKLDFLTGTGIGASTRRECGGLAGESLRRFCSSAGFESYCKTTNAGVVRLESSGSNRFPSMRSANRLSFVRGRLTTDD